MDFMEHFTMETGGHYITMLPADWSISTSHDPLPSSYHSEKMLWNPSIASCHMSSFPPALCHCEPIYVSLVHMTVISFPSTVHCMRRHCDMLHMERAPRPKT